EAILSLVRLGSRGRLFLLLLEHALVADESFEREMTALRRETLASPSLERCCALAQQCFLNEYVWTETEAEAARVAELEQIASTPLQLAALGMYPRGRTIGSRWKEEKPSSACGGGWWKSRRRRPPSPFPRSPRYRTTCRAASRPSTKPIRTRVGSARRSPAPSPCRGCCARSSRTPTLRSSPRPTHRKFSSPAAEPGATLRSPRSCSRTHACSRSTSAAPASPMRRAAAPSSASPTSASPWPTCSSSAPSRSAST